MEAEACIVAKFSSSMQLKFCQCIISKCPKICVQIGTVRLCLYCAASSYNDSDLRRLRLFWITRPASGFLYTKKMTVLPKYRHLFWEKAACQTSFKAIKAIHPCRISWMRAESCQRTNWSGWFCRISVISAFNRRICSTEIWELFESQTANHTNHFSDGDHGDHGAFPQANDVSWQLKRNQSCKCD